MTLPLSPLQVPKGDFPDISAPEIRLSPLRRLRRPLLLGLSAALFVWAALAFDLGAALAAAGRIGAWHLGLAALLVAGNLVLSGLRMRAVLAAAGCRLGLGAALRVNVLSLAGGLFVVPLLGQIASRAVLLCRFGVSPARAAAITLYEKVTAVAIGLAFLVGGLGWLMGPAAWPLVREAAGTLKLPHVAVLALLAIVASHRLGALGIERRLIARLRAGPGLRGIAWSVVLTLAAQACMMGTYVVICHGLDPERPMAPVAAAAGVVMYLAALPISFAGWGIREIASVHFLGLAGFAAPAALAASVLTGVLALLVLAGAALAAMGRGGQGASAPGAAAGTDASRGAGRRERLLSLMIATGAAILVFFQVHVAVSGIKVNVNLADPLIVTGGVAFAWSAFARRQWPQWRVPGFGAMLAAMGATMLVAFLIGLAHFGLTPWALNNRLVGGIVILCAIATGALAARELGHNGMRRVLEAIVAAGTVVALYIFACATLGRVPSLGLFEVLPGLSGISPNRNTLSLQWLLAIVAAIGLIGLGGGRRRRRLLMACVVLLSGAILLALSRALTGGLVLAALFAWALGAISLRRLAIMTASTLVLFAVTPWVAPAVEAFIQILAELTRVPGLAAASTPLPNPDFFLSNGASDNLRWKTIFEGLALWRDNPFFGAGLGAYFHQTQMAGEALVIHSLPVWMLAELGLVGTSVFLWTFAALMVWSRDVMEYGEGVERHVARMIFLALVGLAAAAIFHDVLYQRLFWLMLGALLALPAREDQRPAAGP